MGSGGINGLVLELISTAQKCNSEIPQYLLILGVGYKYLIRQMNANTVFLHSMICNSIGNGCFSKHKATKKKPNALIAFSAWGFFFIGFCLKKRPFRIELHLIECRKTVFAFIWRIKWIDTWYSLLLVI